MRNAIDRSHPLAVVVIGASGDLALKKIFPALFALYCQDLLPNSFHIVGFARSEMSVEAFRERVAARLTCRYVPGERCDEHMREFLARCAYVAGHYDQAGSFRQLHAELDKLDPGRQENRVFYMAIPPFLFLDVAHALRDAELVSQGEDRNWSRVVIEKPFGSDRASSDALTESMCRVFNEEQTYRIDHYLGKEVIQNLLVLRFANLIFDPIWNRTHIKNVRITWTENLSLEGRAGYFDQYGIIRDVMQNHLLQMVALVAMEQPVALHSSYVRDEKVKALRAVAPLKLEDLVVAQYTAGVADGKQHFGYLEEKGTPPGSITPTYAAAVLKLKNRRWDGVPFLIRAGKGLDDSKTEIRIRFREVPGNIFADAAAKLPSNELVISVQPDAGLTMRIVNRVPGLGIRLDETKLDLRYASAFEGAIPDAYESLILDVIQGDKSLFIRADELEAAWDIFTPVLHELEARKVQPETYPFGSAGPEAADALAARFGARW
ncbi:MAG: glucose-6-phosphate dehydrogenase [Candidatus Hydrogenedentes bacterium]|nr:glucose-6-phosphate dehydrogenase [Candidatus Hydrogenedentota bacterium]